MATNTFKNVDLVVAWYNEDLSWIEKMISPNTNIFIYSKLHDSHPTFDVIKLENIGRETHTFLYHICKNYDRLADITIFSQGGILSGAYDFLKKKKLEYILENMDECKKNGVACMAHYKPGIKIKYDPKFMISEWKSTTKENQDCSSIKMATASIRPFGRWYKHYIGDERNIKQLGMSYNCIFSSTSQSIRRRSKDFYENLLLTHSSANDEVSHYLERSFLSLFYMNPLESRV